MEIELNLLGTFIFLGVFLIFGVIIGILIYKTIDLIKRK